MCVFFQTTCFWRSDKFGGDIQAKRQSTQDDSCAVRPVLLLLPDLWNQRCERDIWFIARYCWHSFRHISRTSNVCIVSRQVDAIDYYATEETCYREKCEIEKVNAFRDALGIAFVTFEADDVAVKWVKTFGKTSERWCGFQALSLPYQNGGVHDHYSECTQISKSPVKGPTTHTLRQWAESWVSTTGRWNMRQVRTIFTGETLLWALDQYKNHFWSSHTEKRKPWASIPLVNFRANLSVSPAIWWLKAISINFFCFVLLFFLTTPSIVMNLINQGDYKKAIEEMHVSRIYLVNLPLRAISPELGTSSVFAFKWDAQQALSGLENYTILLSWTSLCSFASKGNFSVWSFQNPLVAHFLPTLILWAVAALLPNLVYYTDQCIGHWTRSSEHHAVMRKTFIFLLLMVLVLPSLGLTRCGLELCFHCFVQSVLQTLKYILKSKCYCVALLQCQGFVWVGCC